MSQPSIQSIVEILKRKKMEDMVVKGIKVGTTSLADCMTRSRDDWGKYYGISGIDVYNYLHGQLNSFRSGRIL